MLQLAFCGEKKYHEGDEQLALGLIKLIIRHRWNGSLASDPMKPKEARGASPYQDCSRLHTITLETCTVCRQYCSTKELVDGS